MSELKKLCKTLIGHLDSEKIGITLERIKEICEEHE